MVAASERSAETPSEAPSEQSESLDETAAACARLDFVVKLLSRISALCGSGRKWSPLREACTYACSQLRSEGAVHSRPERLMSLCFVPIRLAAESRTSRVMETALDCLQKLFVHACITGDMRWVAPHIPYAEPVWMGSVREWAKLAKGREGVEARHGDLLVHHCVDCACAAASFPHDGVQLQVIKALLSAVSTPSCGCRGGSLMQAVRTTFNMHVLASNPVNATTAKAALNQMVSIVFQRMQEGPRPTPRTPRGQPTTPGTASPHAESASPRRRVSAPDVDGRVSPASPFGSADGEPMTVRQHDAFLIFRSLCRLSSREIPEASPPESTERKSKHLSLELLLAMVLHSSDAFRSNEHFMTAVRQNLCLTLLDNCVSSISGVFSLSLRIFLALTNNFKDHLKREIGLFFTNVLLVIVDSPHATYQQKSLVLCVLYRVCESPQTIIDIFVNYDCDLKSVNIFERMVNHLSRLVQRHESEKTALRVLVMVLRSMTQWTEAKDKGSFDHPPPQSLQSTQRDEVGEDGSVRGQLASPAAPAEDETAGDEAQGDADDVEQKKQRKKELEQVLSAFSKSAKAGLKMVWERGVVQQTERATAQWLKDTPGLDKRQVGEYLSRSGPFEMKVLSEFVELFDFGGMEIDEAIRSFLSKFKICGEAQVIDRTMEKFAEQYTQANKESFSNAGTAFVLAFSIIMLNTDAHSDQIKEKMTKKQFLSNNRGLDDGKDLDHDLLSAIYDRVTSRPFTLEGETRGARREHPKSGQRFVSDEKKRARGYEAEMRNALQNTRELFQRSGSGEEGAFFFASKREHVKPMFAVAWSALLPAFSVLLEQSDDRAVIDQCLEGFLRAIHISCIFYLDTERDAFVSALSKLTFLDTYRAIEAKNIRSIRMLIHIAGTEGNYLRSSWFPILRCISQLDKAKVLASTAKPDFHFLETADSNPRTAEEKLRHYEQVNSQTITDAIDEDAITRVYSSTAELDNDAIVEFVKCLCQVSTEEITHSTPPRKFSLQKLVEVADANMGRIRYVWTRLCSILSPHFIQVGTNPSLHVSMYGIDSLKQLASKFLAKQELAGYTFQRDFLRPFALILEQSKLIEVRELIVRCLSQMVHRDSANIRSGWYSIFAVLSRAAADPDEGIVGLAFESLKEIQQSSLHLVVAAEAAVDMLNSLVAFACQGTAAAAAERGVEALVTMAPFLLDGVPPPAATPQEPRRLIVCPPLPADGVIGPDDNLRLTFWFTILNGLCMSTTQHPNLSVRRSALRALFLILHTHGGIFSAGVWRLILNGSVRPIFDNAFCDLSLQSRDAAARAGAEVLIGDALRELHAVQLRYFPQLRQHLGEMLGYAVQCCRVPTPESVPQAGRRALAALLLSHGSGTEGSWSSLAPGYVSAGDGGAAEMLDEAEWSAVSGRLSALLSSLFPPQLRELQCQGGALVADVEGITAPPLQVLAAGAAPAGNRGRAGSLTRKASSLAAAARRVTKPREPTGPDESETRVAVLREGVLLLQLAQLQEHLPAHCGMVACVGPAVDVQCLTDLLSAPAAVHAAAASCVADSGFLDAVLGAGAQALFSSVVAVESRARKLHLAGLFDWYLPYQGKPEGSYPAAQQRRRADEVTREAVGQLLLPAVAETFDAYGAAVAAVQSGRQEVKELLEHRRDALTSVVVAAVHSLTDLDDDRFAATLPSFYASVLALITSGAADLPLLSAAQRYFARVGALRLGLDLPVRAGPVLDPLQDLPPLAHQPADLQPSSHRRLPPGQPPSLFQKQ
eukprot:TRINITY_DN19254_c0_g2_i1.p1 TRINITY_DN19254_c0_g2~~TRINITY_DN19254_c0_g2_i1.p1  ORF type:complete len:1758 (+),score=638.33 TRINITY_DN19254_c0_g2_i1:52-5325(+)